MSYSHVADTELAPVLQTGVEKFAKRWNQVRALRLFRDQTSLSADPSLWGPIERALEASTWFVLLASPEAAASRWVDREVRWWLEHRSASRLLIVLTAGTIQWDGEAGDFDWRRTDALPPALRGAYQDEPRWVDASWSQQGDRVSRVNPQLQDAIIDVASAIRGVPKDQLVGTAVQEHRRTVRIARAAQLTLAALLVVAIVASIVAIVQRRNAVAQATVAESRQLAAVAQNELSTNLDTAMLLAAKAYRTNPNPQTRAALLQADLASPHLVRYLPMGGQVEVLAGDDQQQVVVAGLADGRVMLRQLGAPAPRRVLRFPAPVSGVAISGDGRVVLGVDGTRALLWRQGQPSIQLPGPPRQKADAVALSPSGRTAAVHFSEGYGQAQSMSIFDGTTGRLVATHPHSGFFSPILTLPSDGELVMVDGGHWKRRGLPGWSTEGSGNVGFGAHDGDSNVAADGGAFTFTNGDPTIPVFRTSRAGDVPAFTAQAPISAPNALALSPDARKLAVADSGTIFVAPVARAGTPRAAAVQLTGFGSIATDGMRFYGDDNHLISASRDAVALWDLNQVDRLARVTPTSLPDPCNGCAGADVAVSSDHTRVAALAESGVVQHLAAQARPFTLTPTEASLGPPVWDQAGTEAVFPISSGSLQAWPGVRVWPAGGGDNEPPVASALAADGRSVIVVDQRGDVFVHDFTAGTITETVPGPPELASQDSALELARGMVSIDPTQWLVAFIVGEAGGPTAGGTALVRDIRHRTTTHVPGANVQYVTFSGDHLLIQRTTGALEVWNAEGTRRERTLSGDGSFSWPPAADAQGRVVARPRTDGSTVLQDLNSGATLATMGPPQDPSLGLKLGLAFSPDGNQLVLVSQTIAGAPAEIVARDLSDRSLIATACTTAGRRLTATEWRAFVGTTPPDDLACQ